MAIENGRLPNTWSRCHTTGNQVVCPAIQTLSMRVPCHNATAPELYYRRRRVVLGLTTGSTNPAGLELSSEFVFGKRASGEVGGAD